MKNAALKYLFRNERIRRALMLGAALSLIALGFVLLLLPLTAHGEKPQKISFSAEHWSTTGGVDFVKHNGMDAMELKAGNSAQHVPTGQA